MRFMSLVKAVFSQDMNLFNFRANKNSKPWQRLLLPCVLAAVIMLGIGYYAFNIIEFLSALGSPDLVLVILSILLSVFSLLEGIYKVQGILFECKDNDLLFSLPVPRYKIFALRVIKLLSFQIAFNAIFAVPVLAAYAIALNPAPIFYLVAVMMLILLPLIPTAIAVVLGYIIKSISIKFRHQKLFQIILTFLALGLIFFVLSNSEGIKADLITNSEAIAASASGLYYPANAFARISSNFNWADFVGVIAMCVLPLIIVIYLCSIRYFKIISKSSVYLEKSKTGNFKLHQTSKTFALIKKEISTIFASPVLVVNSLFGGVLLILAVTAASFNLDGIVSLFAGEEGVAISSEDIMSFLPLFYTGALILMASTTSITSSLISLEGKSFNITKSLPVSPGRILLGKVLASIIVSLPLFLIANLIFTIKFNMTLSFVGLTLSLLILILSFSSLIGLIVNLKYPKMDATNEAEVVKQSASSFASVLIGVMSGLGAVATLIVISVFTNFNAPLLIAGVYLILDVVLYRVLITYGAKKFRQIEI